MSSGSMPPSLMGTSTDWAKLGGAARLSWYDSGYTAAIALRWTVLAGILRMLVHGPEPVRTSRNVLVPAEEVLMQRVRLAAFLLDRADEARRLAAHGSVS
jgi:hypothetical protein